MDELAIKSLKNYQVWHHRRLLVTITREVKQELAFIQKCLRVDEKNYHTWSYRQWILAHFGGTGNTMDENQLEDSGDNSLWEGELDFIQIMLNNDIRNNSAWHHRFFVVWACGIREGEEDRVHIFKRELTYVKQSISIVPNNVAAWNYLRGILKHNARPFSSIKDFITPYTIPSPGSVANRNIVDLENPPPAEGAELPVPAAIEFMADIWEEEGTKEGLDKAYEVRMQKLYLPHTDFFSFGNLCQSTMTLFARSEYDFIILGIYFEFIIQILGIPHSKRTREHQS